MRVLVAEHDVFLRSLLGATLRRLSHDPVVVADGQAAIEAYRMTYFSLVISSVVMPRVNGLELCNLIRKERSQDYTYIILLAVMEETRKILEGLQAGADDFITQPFNEDVLAARIIVSDRILNVQHVNRALAQLVPVCSYCKKARSDRNYWQRIEESILNQANLQLSHGICPECYKNTVRPELDRIRERQSAAHEASGQSGRF
jgi:sigma-B regulation protein RsbU (phosphoserine phosphatase)